MLIRFQASVPRLAPSDPLHDQVTLGSASLRMCFEPALPGKEEGIIYIAAKDKHC